jgi:hypothetical protein
MKVCEVDKPTRCALTPWNIARLLYSAGISVAAKPNLEADSYQAINTNISMLFCACQSSLKLSLTKFAARNSICDNMLLPIQFRYSPTLQRRYAFPRLLCSYRYSLLCRTPDTLIIFRHQLQPSLRIIRDSSSLSAFFACIAFLFNNNNNNKCVKLDKH